MAPPPSLLFEELDELLELEEPELDELELPEDAEPPEELLDEPELLDESELLLEPLSGLSVFVVPLELLLPEFPDELVSPPEDEELELLLASPGFVVPLSSALLPEVL